MRWMTSYRRVAAVLSSLVLLVTIGCGEQISSKDAFLERLFEQCKRSQSRMTPAPMRLSMLHKLLNSPDKVVQIGDKEQEWEYQFADGTVTFSVMVEPGHHWIDEDPRVFVNLRGLAEIAQH